MFTEVSGVGGGEVAVLRTPTFPGSGYFCVAFSYHMYGADMGDMEVKAATPSNPQGEVMFKFSGTGRK